MSVLINAGSHVRGQILSPLPQSAEMTEIVRLDQQISQFIAQGRFRDAIPLAERVLELRQHRLKQNDFAVIDSLHTLASLYLNQGRYAEAEPLFKKALTLHQQSENPENFTTATMIHNLAVVYMSQGRYADAEPLFKQALTLHQKTWGENDPNFATILNSLGMLYVNQHQYKEAETFLKQALTLRQRTLPRNHPSIATSLNNLAGVYLRQRRYGEAESLFQAALELRRNSVGEDHPAVAENLHNLAVLYSHQGRYAEAASLLQKAVELYQRTQGQDHILMTRILDSFASLKWEQGDYILARDYFQQKFQIEEQSLALNLINGFERQQQQYLNLLSDTVDSSISLHLHELAQDPIAKHLAFTAILQRKGRILDLLANNQQLLRQHLDPKGQKLLSELSHRRSELATLFFNPSKLSPEHDRVRFEEIDRQIKTLEDQLNRYSTQFRTQTQEEILEAVQQALLPNRALVELVQYRPFKPNYAEDKGFAAPRYAAYILTAQGQSQGIDLGDTLTINQAIETFRAALRDRQTPPAQLKHAARNLDALVMQPVRQLLGNAQTVLLSPDGALNLIPFEALVDENNHYLVETYAFTYLTSGRDLLRLETHSPSQTAAVLLANPTFDKLGEPVTPVLHSQINQNAKTRSANFVNLFKQTFSSLPETTAEVEAIAPLLNVQSLIGSQASEEAVKQVNRPRILHIATHGFFITPTTQNGLPANTLADNPLLLSGLVLAGFKLKPQNREDGILSALEVAGLNLLGTKLVVLSACDTGLGRLSAGEGIYGLRRALAMTGAESQLISLWKVEDTATKDLMVSYYRKLLAGQGRSEALRQTQMEMLKSQDRAHPYYWASFIPSGDWRPLP
jgi:CHAT domain-containing protein/tetratricopeptide (TPR) repeat protein